MKATIKDVARAAGVSPSTVSRALHDSPRISEKVRERVKQAAKALDFHPNQMAKSLVSRKTRIVGIVFPGDVSIVSFNNTDAGKYHIPALTSFEIDPYRLGMSAMHLMADVLKGTMDAPRSIEVPFTLIERDSVGGAPASE